MKNKLFMRVDEVCEELGISKSLAYIIIKDLNAELEAKGFKTINGRISRKYFNEKFYGSNNSEEQKGAM